MKLQLKFRILPIFDTYMIRKVFTLKVKELGQINESIIFFSKENIFR